jgi:hypothetical protein
VGHEETIGRTFNEHCGRCVDIVLKLALTADSLDNVTCLFIGFNNFRKTCFGDYNNKIYNINNAIQDVRTRLNDDRTYFTGNYPFKENENIKFNNLKLKNHNGIPSKASSSSLNRDIDSNFKMAYDSNSLLKDYIDANSDNEMNEDLSPQLSPREDQRQNEDNLLLYRMAPKNRISISNNSINQNNILQVQGHGNKLTTYGNYVRFPNQNSRINPKMNSYENYKKRYEDSMNILAKNLSIQQSANNQSLPSIKKKSNRSSSNSKFRLIK